MDLKDALKKAVVCYVGDDGVVTLPDNMRNKRLALVQTEFSLLLMPVTPTVNQIIAG